MGCYFHLSLFNLSHHALVLSFMFFRSLPVEVCSVVPHVRYVVLFPHFVSLQCLRSTEGMPILSALIGIFRVEDSDVIGQSLADS